MSSCFVWEFHTCIHCLWIKSTHLFLPSAPPFPHHYSFPSSCALVFFFFNPLLAFSLVCTSVRQSAGAWRASQGRHSWRSLTLPPLVAISCQKLWQVGGLRGSSPSGLGLWWAWSCTGLVHPVTVTVSSWAQRACRARETVLLWVSSTSGSFILPCPSLVSPNTPFL